MKFMQKLKWLFLIKRPAGQIVDAVAEAKKTKRWLHMSVTIVGVLASTVGALAGYIPPVAQLIVATTLQTIYNIVRGADKADNADVKGTLRTSEFWLSGLTELQKGFVALNVGGIQSPWLMDVLSAINFLGLAFGQNLAARNAEPSAPVAPAPAAPAKK